MFERRHYGTKVLSSEKFIFWQRLLEQSRKDCPDSPLDKDVMKDQANLAVWPSALASLQRGCVATCCKLQHLVYRCFGDSDSFEPMISYFGMEDVQNTMQWSCRKNVASSAPVHPISQASRWVMVAATAEPVLVPQFQAIVLWAEQGIETLLITRSREQLINEPRFHNLAKFRGNQTSKATITHRSSNMKGQYFRVFKLCPDHRDIGLHS